MKNQEPKKVAWTIRNFSTLKTNTQYRSKVFTIDLYAWRIALYRGRQDGKNLAMFLEVVDPSSLPKGWSIYAEFSLMVVNQFSRESSERKDLEHKFSANTFDWGFPSFMSLTRLEDSSSGYILNDKCTVEVEISTIRSEGIELIGELAYEEDVVDFKDLGKIEKSFVPLLEEVCLLHPSLMECKKIRSCKFTEWAFTALGRVLQFLKNRKWKDMNEEACDQLRYLWEELQISRLELSWLKPFVESAINMRGYKEKVEKVKMLKENLVALETEMKLSKEKLDDTEQSVEIIKKDLIKTEEVFEEKGLDAKIGYGKP